MLSSPFPKRVLAFVDILGFRALVARMEGDAALYQRVRGVLALIAEQEARIIEYRQERDSDVPARKEGSPARTRVMMTSFSDCYVMSERLVGAWRVVGTVQALCAMLLEQGILTRGGIVADGVQHGDGLLFGPALIRAYDMERRQANYPRIIVEGDVVKRAWRVHAGIYEGRLFRRSADGWWHVNPMTPPLSRWKALVKYNAPHEDPQRDFALRIREVLLARQRESTGAPRHLMKVSWLIDEFNAAVADALGIAPIAVNSV